MLRSCCTPRFSDLAWWEFLCGFPGNKFPWNKIIAKPHGECLREHDADQNDYHFFTMLSKSKFFWGKKTLTIEEVLKKKVLFSGNMGNFPLKPIKSKYLFFGESLGPRCLRDDLERSTS